MVPSPDDIAGAFHSSILGLPQQGGGAQHAALFFLGPGVPGLHARAKMPIYINSKVSGAHLTRINVRMSPV
jgi:hypothetical protein